MKLKIVYHDSKIPSAINWKLVQLKAEKIWVLGSIREISLRSVLFFAKVAAMEYLMEHLIWIM